MAVCAAGILSAHVVLPAEFRELVAEADLIVRGMVTDVRAIAVPNGGIDSVATVAVESVVKGQASSFVSVRVPGGAIGGTRFVMIGAPTFRTGDRALLLLRRAPDNFYRPLGLSMGVHRVHVDAGSGASMVAAPVVAGRTAATGPVVRGDVRRRAMRVEELESLIRLLSIDRAVRRSPRP